MKKLQFLWLAGLLLTTAGCVTTVWRYEPKSNLYQKYVNGNPTGEMMPVAVYLQLRTEKMINDAMLQQAVINYWQHKTDAAKARAAQAAQAAEQYRQQSQQLQSTTDSQITIKPGYGGVFNVYQGLKMMGHWSYDSYLDQWTFTPGY